MLFTQDKPIDEILESVAGEKNIYLLACNGCAEVCKTGGQEALSAMKVELEKAGKSITGVCLVDFLCNKLLVATRLAREMDKIEQADSMLILSCGIGVQAVARVVDKTVHPAANTVSLGALQGLWPRNGVRRAVIVRWTTRAASALLLRGEGSAEWSVRRRVRRQM